MATPSNSTAPKRRGRPPGATLAQARPDLAAQLVDPSLGHTLSRGSSTKAEWKCALGHTWHAAVYNRVNSKNPTGCPVCDGKKVLPGFNDVATTHPSASALLTDQTLATAITAFSNKKVDLTCAAGHQWQAPMSRLTAQGSGCPYCSGRKSVVGSTDLISTHPELAAQLVDQTLATKLKAGSHQVVEWRCAADKTHTWKAYVDGRTGKGVGCPFCSGRRAIPGRTDISTTHPEIAATLADPTQGSQVSSGSDRKLSWICEADPSHVWSASVYNRVFCSNCPFCANRAVIAGQNDLATTHPETAAQLVDPAQALTTTYGSGTPLLWQCSAKTEHTWLAPPARRTGKNGTGCPHCLGPLPSAAEKELAGVISTLVEDEVLTSDQTVLPGRYELDIVVPSKNFAVEFNGVYWHSEASGKPATYHADKAEMADAAGYQLVQVWEDDWLARQDIIIRSLAHKLGCAHRLPQVIKDIDPKATQRVYARKLTPGAASGGEAAVFLQANHIQGPVSASIHLVLRDSDGAIRALLSVRSPSSNARMKRGPGDWEVQRYATCGVVPGGFTRLLKYAEKTLLESGRPLTQWISFSARDISDGGLYEMAGFQAQAHLAPDYRYVGNATNWVRRPKEKFQRKNFRENPDLLWDENWTERQAAAENKLYRVYDSGKTRWAKPVTQV